MLWCCIEQKFLLLVWIRDVLALDMSGDLDMRECYFSKKVYYLVNSVEFNPPNLIWDKHIDVSSFFI